MISADREIINDIQATIYTSHDLYLQLHLDAIEDLIKHSYYTSYESKYLLPLTKTLNMDSFKFFNFRFSYK